MKEVGLHLPVCTRLSFVWVPLFLWFLYVPTAVSPEPRARDELVIYSLQKRQGTIKPWCRVGNNTRQTKSIAVLRNIQDHFLQGAPSD